jgi:drug/metabolite transporter (DMT)-like permease
MQVLYAMLFATLCATAGDALLSYGMKQVGKENHAGIAFLWATLRNGYVGTGILLLTMFFGLYAHALSRADLSVVLPLTALSYVFAAVVASFILHETVTPMRWFGTCIIMVGVTVVIKSE